MIKIRISEDERLYEEIDSQWINQQINRRLEHGLPICVRVTIQQNDLNMILITPACQTSGGIGRPFNSHENEVFQLWEKRGLTRSGFTGGNLIAFLNQLERYL